MKFHILWWEIILSWEMLSEFFFEFIVPCIYGIFLFGIPTLFAIVMVTLVTKKRPK